MHVNEVKILMELNKFSAAKSVPEALETYTKFVSQRMQMARQRWTPDGRRSPAEFPEVRAVGTADRDHVSSTYLRDRRALMKRAHDG
jgi:hypothetical protein